MSKYSLKSLGLTAGKTQDRNDDFYIAVNVLGRSVLAVVGDFTGEGPRGINRTLKADLEQFFERALPTWRERGIPPQNMLQAAIQHVNKWLQERRTPARTTLIAAHYDSRTNLLWYVSAGDSGLAVLEGGQLRFLRQGDMSGRRDASAHLPQSGSQFEVYKEQVAPGAVVCLYSDGLWENTAHLPQRQQPEQFLGQLLQAEDLKQLKVQLESQLFSGSSRPDDITMVVLKEEAVAEPEQQGGITPQKLETMAHAAVKRAMAPYLNLEPAGDGPTPMEAALLEALQGAEGRWGAIETRVENMVSQGLQTAQTRQQDQLAQHLEQFERSVEDRLEAALSRSSVLNKLEQSLQELKKIKSQLKGWESDLGKTRQTGSKVQSLQSSLDGLTTAVRDIRQDIKSQNDAHEKLTVQLHQMGKGGGNIDVAPSSKKFEAQGVVKPSGGSLLQQAPPSSLSWHNNRFRLLVAALLIWPLILLGGYRLLLSDSKPAEPVAATAGLVAKAERDDASSSQNDHQDDRQNDHQNPAEVETPPANSDNQQGEGPRPSEASFSPIAGNSAPSPNVSPQEDSQPDEASQDNKPLVLAPAQIREGVSAELKPVPLPILPIAALSISQEHYRRQVQCLAEAVFKHKKTIAEALKGGQNQVEIALGDCWQSSNPSLTLDLGTARKVYQKELEAFLEGSAFVFKRGGKAEKMTASLWLQHTLGIDKVDGLTGQGTIKTGAAAIQARIDLGKVPKLPFALNAAEALNDDLIKQVAAAFKQSEQNFRTSMARLGEDLTRAVTRGDESEVTLNLQEPLATMPFTVVLSQDGQPTPAGTWLRNNKQLALDQRQPNKNLLALWLSARLGIERTTGDLETPTNLLEQFDGKSAEGLFTNLIATWK